MSLDKIKVEKFLYFLELEIGGYVVPALFMLPNLHPAYIFFDLFLQSKPGMGLSCHSRTLSLYGIDFIRSPGPCTTVIVGFLLLSIFLCIIALICVLCMIGTKLRNHIIVRVMAFIILFHVILRFSSLVSDFSIGMFVLTILFVALYIYGFVVLYSLAEKFLDEKQRGISNQQGAEVPLKYPSELA